MADNDYFPERLTEDERAAVEETEEKGEPVALTAETLAEILAAEREKNEALIRSIVGAKAGPLQSDVAAPELEFSTDGLPDPSVDFHAYQKAYTERAKQAVGRAVQQGIQQATSNAQQIAAAESAKARCEQMIRDAAPDLPEELIGMAAQAVANRYKQSGQDPLQTLMGDVEGVAQQILDYADDMVTRITGGRGEDLPRQMPQGRRTAGLVPPRNRAPAPPKQQEKPGNMVDELRNIQTKMRIY